MSERVRTLLIYTAPIVFHKYNPFRNRLVKPYRKWLGGIF